MASSKMQDIIICQLCEVNTKVTVNCLECDLYMCQRCTEKVHSKFKNADLHEIVDLKDLASARHQTPTKVTLKSVKCSKHKHQTYCMYCVECGYLVCTTCISNEHKKHEFSEIEEFFRGKEKNFDKSSSKIITSIEQYVEEKERTTLLETSKFTKLKEDTMQEEESAKAKIHLQYKEKLECIEKQSLRTEKMLTKQREDALKVKSEIQNARQELKAAFESNDPSLIFKSVAPFESKLKSLSNCFEALSLHDFSGNLDIDVIVEVIKALTPNVFIGSISSDNEGYIWISNGKTIKQIDPEDARKIQTYTANETVLEIRCTNTVGTKLLLTSGTKILKLTSKGNFETLRNFYPEKPGTIHITPSGRIIVGMDFVVGKQTIDEPIIAVLGTDGKTIAEYRNTDRKLLSHATVRACTSLEDGTICYNDTNNSVIGRTVKLDLNGHVEWVYKGKKDSFFPVEVLTTKSNNIVISDEQCNLLHVLTAVGDVLKLLDLTEMGIQEIGVMTVDKNDHLWTSDDKKLYCLKYSGF